MRQNIVLTLVLAACSGEPASPTPVEPTAPPVPAPQPSSEPAPEPPPAPAHPAAGPDSHGWTSISFVPHEHAFGLGSRLAFDLQAQPTGMTLRATAWRVRPDPFANAQVRLHFADGRVVEPAPSGLGLRGVANEAPDFHTFFVDLAWQANQLDEAFVEVSLESGRWWLEVPYGFVRDPSAPLPERDPRDAPRRPAAMNPLSDRDHVVPFRHVDYDVGEIQNGWRLNVRHSNAFDAYTEVVLYRDDGRVGESAYRWQLHEPRTTVEIHPHGGGVIESRPNAIRLHEDGMRRSDEHSFNRAPGPPGRGWGTLVVRVDDRSFEIRIPSSLYGYTHGTSDPYDPHRIVYVPDVLGPMRD